MTYTFHTFHGPLDRHYMWLTAHPNNIELAQISNNLKYLLMSAVQYPIQSVYLAFQSLEF